MPPVLVREFEHWKVLKASESDTKCYYFNTKTKEVTWLVPACLRDESRNSRSRQSVSSTNSGPFGTHLPIDKVMLDPKNDDGDTEYEQSRSESDRPRHLSIHGFMTVNSPQPPPAPPVPSPAFGPVLGPSLAALECLTVEDRLKLQLQQQQIQQQLLLQQQQILQQQQLLQQQQQLQLQSQEQVPEVSPPKPAWKPTVGESCGALWVDGHFWKATVMAEDVNGLRYKVMYDVDGTEAMVAREALRPAKSEAAKPALSPPILRPSASSVMSRPQSPNANPQNGMARSASASSSWTPSKEASNARSEMIARQNTLVQTFNAEFPNLRLPTLEDFYRPQYAAALQRFGQQDFELLCDAQKGKGPIGFFKQKGFLK